MASERTEKATPKRRQDARKKGQIARRPELSAAVGFLSAVVTLRVLGGDIAGRAASLFATTMAHAGRAESLKEASAHAVLVDAVATLASISLPVIAAALAGGLAANFAQGGLTLTPAALKPRAEKFNPASNLKRVFGPNGLVEFGKGLLKLGGIALLSYAVFARAVAQAPALVGTPARETFAVAGQLVFDIALRAGGVLALVALLDYGYGWYRHEKSLKMSKQEVKDEFRQQEGDPLVKSQRRRAARARLQKKIAVEVPRADVVVTNPTHFAVALRYDRARDAAPVVVAKGADLMAKRIREIAAEHGVAVVENPPLARGLYRSVEAGQVIPPDFFRAVAELLAYVYQLRARAG